MILFLAQSSSLRWQCFCRWYWSNNISQILTGYLHISIHTWVISSLIVWTVTTAFSNVTTLSEIILDIWLFTLHQSALLVKKSDNINKVSAQSIPLCIFKLFCSNQHRARIFMWYCFIDICRYLQIVDIHHLYRCWNISSVYRWFFRI